MIESKVYGLRRSADRRYGVVPQCDSQCVGCELCPRGSADTRRGKKTRCRAGSRRKSDALRVVLIGVPNCGKTTLLNALTGSRLRTGNCPGVTVGESAVRSGEITYIDLPGVYSLSPSGSEGADESEVARRRLYGGGYDAVLCVADASAPERSLGLAVRLSAAGIPFVLAMNMADTARKKGVRTRRRRAVGPRFARASSRSGACGGRGSTSCAPPSPRPRAKPRRDGGRTRRRARIRARTRPQRLNLIRTYLGKRIRVRLRVRFRASTMLSP